MQAARIYATASGDATYDANLKAFLEGAGHTVVTGVPWYQISATQSWNGIDVIVLAAPYNYSNPWPDAGQANLSQAVAAGRGLVVTAWLNYQVGSIFANAGPAYDMLPATNAAGAYRPATVTNEAVYTRVAADPVINDGVSNTFTFTATEFEGIEQVLVPKAGATLFYDSGTQPGYGTVAGLIGWNFAKGRVINFSVICGSSEFADPNMSRLIRNAVKWAVVPDTQAPKMTTKASVTTTKSKVVLTGTVSDNSPNTGEIKLKATVPKARAKVALKANGTFTVTVSPIKASTRVTLVATDRAGNSSKKVVRIIRKVAP